MKRYQLYGEVVNIRTQAEPGAVEAAVTASRALLGVVARSVTGALELVTLPQFRVLVVLATAEPMRMGALADRMGVLPSTFSRSIDRMVKEGWVRRIASPDSRREVLIELTSDGRSLVDDVTERRRRDIARILSTMTPDDQDVLCRGLEAFAEAAGESPAEELLTLGI